MLEYLRHEVTKEKGEQMCEEKRDRNGRNGKAIAGEGNKDIEGVRLCQLSIT
jgi:hypothetical protein